MDWKSSIVKRNSYIHGVIRGEKISKSAFEKQAVQDKK
jgi:hypothetical protein